MKLGLCTSILLLVIGLVGCSNAESSNKTNSAGSSVTVKVDSKVVDKKDSVEGKKLSFAKRHHDLIEEDIKMFALDQEYSESLHEFFGVSEKPKDYEVDALKKLEPSQPNENLDYIDFYANVYVDNAPDATKKLLFRVRTNEFHPTTLNNVLMLDGPQMRFQIVPNETERIRSLEADAANRGAVKLDPSESMFSGYEDIKDHFDEKLVYKEGVTGGKEYMFYKYIPLSEDYKLEIQVSGIGHDFIQRKDEILYRLDNIIINPALVEM